jgi:hypothetical protein
MARLKSGEFGVAHRHISERSSCTSGRIKKTGDAQIDQEMSKKNVLGGAPWQTS